MLDERYYFQENEACISPIIIIIIIIKIQASFSFTFLKASCKLKRTYILMRESEIVLKIWDVGHFSG